MKLKTYLAIGTSLFLSNCSPTEKTANITGLSEKEAVFKLTKKISQNAVNKIIENGGTPTDNGPNLHYVDSENGISVIDNKKTIYSDGISYFNESEGSHYAIQISGRNYDKEVSIINTDYGVYKLRPVGSDTLIATINSIINNTQ